MRKTCSAFLLKIPLAISLLLASAFAQAADYPDFTEPFNFSLLLSNSRVDLQTGNNNQHVSLDRVSIAVLTLIEPQVQFGFIGGSSNLSIDNDPAAAGMNLSGYHAGLLMRSTLHNILISNLKIVFDANYIYQETKDETVNQMATLRWHEWATSISAKITLGQQLELGVGWEYNEVDAQRRSTGNINETQSLKLRSSSQGKLEATWLASNGGHVDLTVQRGSYQQIEFRFSQNFK